MSVSNLQNLDHQASTGARSEGSTTATEGVLSDSKIRYSTWVLYIRTYIYIVRAYVQIGWPTFDRK